MCLPWPVLAVGAVLVVYATFVLVLLVAGRREGARAVAGFIPDCVRLFRGLIGDERVARRHKLILGATLLYLLMPIDLVPDVIPVAGQLDDAVFVALALRSVLRAAEPGLLDEHWPGPSASLRLLRRLIGGRRCQPRRGC